MPRDNWWAWHTAGIVPFRANHRCFWPNNRRRRGRLRFLRLKPKRDRHFRSGIIAYYLIDAGKDTGADKITDDFVH